jgi:CBS domain-containing protein
VVPLGVPQVRGDAAPIDALVTLSYTNVGRGFVLGEDRLVGIISAGDARR